MKQDSVQYHFFDIQRAVSFKMSWDFFTHQIPAIWYISFNTAVSRKNEVAIRPKFNPSALKLNYFLKCDFILKDYHINLFSIKFCICYMLFDSKCIDSFRNL